METSTIFWIALTVGGIATILFLAMFSEVSVIMKKENASYTGHINNYIDALRIVKAFFKSRSLSSKDKRTLGFSVVLLSISHVAFILIVLIFISSPGAILD